MSSKLSPLRGMKDLLPKDFRVHKHIEETAFNTAKLYGYEGFSTPILEAASVFDRTLGDTSDVVSKEMYSFTSKGGDLIALRPEFTAGVIRAFISNGLKQQLPLKLFSSGPVFRYDRPQKGRQRQFNQLNFEYIGAKGPISDAETICLATHILEKLDILQDVTLELNSLGCTESRQSYQAALIEYFKGHFDELSEDSKQRLYKNPLRILDSKDESDKKIAKGAPVITEYYTSSAAEYFEQVKSYLDKMQVKYVVNPKLARGLDYYSHTAFEFITDKLGSQSTVLAGGRYDGLTALMGEGEIPSIGFAAGIERIALMNDTQSPVNRPVFIIPIGDECKDYAITTACNLRKNNITTQVELEGKVNKRMQNAIAKNANFVIFIGSEELENKSYKLKNLDVSNEIEVTYNELLAKLL
ncbi:MAG: histidine--tRNA ligase [Rickettsiaceae bacterium]|nr:histidine--tRNA ligase [Rickettsiaceae bacterium]